MPDTAGQGSPCRHRAPCALLIRSSATSAPSLPCAMADAGGGGGRWRWKAGPQMTPGANERGRGEKGREAAIPLCRPRGYELR